MVQEALIRSVQTMSHCSGRRRLAHNYTQQGRRSQGSNVGCFSSLLSSAPLSGDTLSPNRTPCSPPPHPRPSAGGGLVVVFVTGPRTTRRFVALFQESSWHRHVSTEEHAGSVLFDNVRLVAFKWEIEVEVVHFVSYSIYDIYRHATNHHSVSQVHTPHQDWLTC